MKVRGFLFLILFLFFSTCINLFSQQEDCVVVEYVTECKVENRKKIVEESVLLQINNRAGEGHANFSITYQQDEGCKILEAQIEGVFGNVIRKLRKQDIHEKSLNTGSFNKDYMEKTFTMKHNVYPYRIRLKHRVETGKFVHLARWSPDYKNIVNTKVNKAVLKIVVPADYEIMISEKKIEHHVEKTEDKKIYTWNAVYKGDIKREIYSPPLSDIVPNVLVVPKVFKYGVEGKQNNWSEYGNWEFNLNKGRDLLPPSEKIKIDALVSGVDGPVEKIRALYHYMQDNHRYINVSTGIGGLQTHPAAYVCENRYGDCKALSNFMVSVLNYAGIKSYYTNIFSNEKINSFDTSLYSTTHFNHIIAMIPVQNDTIWLECTSKTNPFGYVGTSIQNRFSLPVQEFHSKLVKTPALQFNDVLEESHYQVSFLDRNRASVEALYNFKGDKFEQLNYIENEYNSEINKKILERNLNFENYQLNSWEIIHENRDSLNVKLNVNVELGNFHKEYGEYLLFELLKLEIPGFEKPEKRTLPVQIDFPRYRVNKAVYHVPARYAAKANLSDTSILSDYGAYKLNIDVSGNDILVHKEFKLFRGNYPVEEYEKFYGFLDQIYSLEKSKLALTKK